MSSAFPYTISQVIRPPDHDNLEGAKHILEEFDVPSEGTWPSKSPYPDYAPTQFLDCRTSITCPAPNSHKIVPELAIQPGTLIFPQTPDESNAVGTLTRSSSDGVLGKSNNAGKPTTMQRPTVPLATLTHSASQTSTNVENAIGGSQNPVLSVIAPHSESSQSSFAINTQPSATSKMIGRPSDKHDAHHGTIDKPKFDTNDPKSTTIAILSDTVPKIGATVTRDNETAVTNIAFLTKS
jgi:hypothetical protein